MSEDVKVGCKAWVWEDSQSWSKEQYELLSVGKVFVYNIGGMMQMTTKVTTQNPHEKKCELLKEGEELWEYDDGYFNGRSLQSLYNGLLLPLLQGFVIELGSGEHKKVGHPIKFTGEKDSANSGCIASYESITCPNRCKIIGCIMSKGE